jgi:hypothetical protein
VWRGPRCLARYDAQGRPLQGPARRPARPRRGLHRLPRPSHPRTARAQAAPGARLTGRPIPQDPPRPPLPRRRRGPRLPVGPGA